MSMRIRCFRRTIWVWVLGLSLVLAASSGATVPNSQARPSVRTSNPGELVNVASSLKWIRAFSDFFPEKQPEDFEDSFCEAAWPTGDGRLVLAGQAKLSPAGPNAQPVCDLILMKVSPTGGVEWLTAYESKPQEDFTITWGEGGMVRLGDGNFLLVAQRSTYDQGAGTFENHPVLIKLSPGGGFLWARLIGVGRKGESLHDSAKPPAPTADGGAIIAGDSISMGSWLVKLDSRGEVAWGKKLSIGIGLGRPCGTSDGGFALIGYSSNRQAVLVKFDSRGSIQWHRNYSQGADWGCGRVQSYASAVAQTSDGGYVISGSTSGYDCGGDDRAASCFCKLTSSGEIAWQKEFYAGHILPSRAGGFIVHKDSGDLAKVGTAGSRQWYRLFEDTMIESATEAENGDLVVTGHVYPEDSSRTVMEVLYLNSAGTMANPCPLISSPTDTTAVGDSGLRAAPATVVTAVSYPLWTEPRPDQTVPRGCKVTTRCVS
ncbi:MAG TPA: hypothetical protein VLN41_01555, partial [Candidatus Bathyarchaeia archaeon]|nr:hypothetical protein [Candidatus Bathyarchaeia archaeon]